MIAVPALRQAADRNCNLGEVLCRKREASALFVHRLFNAKEFF